MSSQTVQSGVVVGLGRFQGTIDCCSWFWTTRQRLLLQTSEVGVATALPAVQQTTSNVSSFNTIHEHDTSTTPILTTVRIIPVQEYRTTIATARLAVMTGQFHIRNFDRHASCHHVTQILAPLCLSYLSISITENWSTRVRLTAIIVHGNPSQCRR